MDCGAGAPLVEQFQGFPSRGLCGSGQRVGKGHRNSAGGGRNRDLAVTRGTRFRGSREDQHNDLLPSSLLPPAGAPRRHPKHKPREAHASFQKSSMQKGLLGGKWVLTARLPIGLGERRKSHTWKSISRKPSSGGKSWS